MIVGQLKKNIQVSVILLSLVCLGLWGLTFIYENQVSSYINYNEHVLYTYFFNHHFSFLAIQFTNLISIFLGALFINFLCVEQEITSKTNYLPAFFYLLFSFSSITNRIVEPILIANLFALPAIYFLISSYRKEEALSDFFKAGFFMGSASFFFAHYVILFPLCIVALFTLRSFNWRELCGLIIGLVAPIYLFCCISYLRNNDTFYIFKSMQAAFSEAKNPIISEYYLTFLIISILLLFFTLFHYLSKGFGSKIKTQKIKQILLWMLGLCMLMVFFEQNSDMILLPCIIPLSIVIGDYLAEVKQLKIANTLLFVYIAGFSIIVFRTLGFI